jgi:hypothetical protein
MGRNGPAKPQPWMLFAFPLAIAVPIIVAILLGGPMLGMFVAALVALAIVAVAVRMEPRRWRLAARRVDDSGSDGAGPLNPPSDPGNGGWRAAAARRFAVTAVIAAIGVVLIVATAGTASIIGWGVLAIGLTLAVSLVFLEIGYSEDRARAREERRRARVRPPRHPTRHAP